MNSRKGQTALEYMLILVVAMVVVATVWAFAFNATDDIKERTSGYTGGDDKALFNGDTIDIIRFWDNTITAAEPLRYENCEFDSSSADECAKSGMWIQTNNGKTYMIVSFPSVGPDDFNADTITCDSDIEGSPTSFKVYKNKPMSVSHYEYMGADCVSVAGYGDDEC
jgi:hypothetical protein